MRGERIEATLGTRGQRPNRRRTRVVRRWGFSVRFAPAAGSCRLAGARRDRCWARLQGPGSRFDLHARPAGGLLTAGTLLLWDGVAHFQAAPAQHV